MMLKVSQEYTTDNIFEINFSSDCLSETKLELISFEFNFT